MGGIFRAPRVPTVIDLTPRKPNSIVFVDNFNQHMTLMRRLPSGKDCEGCGAPLKLSSACEYCRRVP